MSYEKWPTKTEDKNAIENFAFKAKHCAVITLGNVYDDNDNDDDDDDDDDDDLYQIKYQKYWQSIKLYTVENWIVLMCFFGDCLLKPWNHLYCISDKVPSNALNMLQ